jgi:hypothetical protein
MVFVVAATALRSSEVLALPWSDVVREVRKIRIVKAWKKTGEDGDKKTPSSECDVPMARVLAHYLREWPKETPTQNRPTPVRLAEEEGQSSDLGFPILPRSLSSTSEEGAGCDPGRAPLGSPQPAAEEHVLSTFANDYTTQEAQRFRIRRRVAD